MLLNYTYLVADSSKVGKSSLASLGAVGLVDYVVTDYLISKEDQKHLIENDIKLVVVDK